MLGFPLPRHIFAGAALSATVACALVSRAAAQSDAPFVVGPARLGGAATYRLTLVSDGSDTSRPDAQTLALRWKLGDKIVATIVEPAGEQGTPYVTTRAADGSFSLDNPNPNDLEGQRVTSDLAVLNRLTRFAAGASAGAAQWNTTLLVQPPAANAPSAQNAEKPHALTIPVTASRINESDGTTLTASGSVTRTVTRPAAGGAGRGGRGGMGGRRGGGGFGGGGGFPGGGGGGGFPGGGSPSGDTSGTSTAPTKFNVTTKVTVSAHFGRDGGLTSGTIVETTSRTDDQSAVTRSWKLERTQ
jgi:hypothetical protein